MLFMSLGLVGLFKKGSSILVDIRLDQDHLREYGEWSEFHGEIYGDDVSVR